MAGQDILHAAVVSPKLLYSAQLGDTNEDTLYTVPANASALIKHGTACNVSADQVTVTLSVLRSGQATGTAIHRVISAYPLAAGDTLALSDYLKDCCLGPGDFITAQASAAGAVDIVLSGVENT